MAAPRLPRQSETDPASGHAAHGGGLDAASQTFAIPKDDWIDLSTGINPFAWPSPASFPNDLTDDDWRRLPDRDAEAELAAAAARHYGAPDVNTVVAAPGSQSLIRLLPRLFPTPLSVAVIEPTYNEHARSWLDSGHTVRAIGDLSGINPDDDVLVLCNPNNPDGRRWAAADLLVLLDRPRAKKLLLVVDEAFADATPETSLAPHIERGDILVLRSFGKFFGLAGARLGFALTADPLAGTIRHALGPWPVSGPAIRLATRAFNDADWTVTTRARIKTAREELEQTLREGGLDVIGGTDLFCLVRHENALDLFLHLGRNGILVRAFPTMPDRLRIGLTASDAAQARLSMVLDSYRK